MSKKTLSLVFAAFLFLTSDLPAQDPPEPMMTTQDSSLESPCGSGDGGNDGGVSPPVGLCLPVNDYLLPLLLCGILLGSYGIWKSEEGIQRDSQGPSMDS